MNFAVGCRPRLFTATRRPLAATRLSETREACNVKASTPVMTVEEVREVQDKETLSIVLSDGTEVPVNRSRKSIVESALLPRLRPR